MQSTTQTEDSFKTSLDAGMAYSCEAVPVIVTRRSARGDSAKRAIKCAECAPLQEALNDITVDECEAFVAAQVWVCEQVLIEAEKMQLKVFKSRLAEAALKLKNERARLAQEKKAQDERARRLNEQAKELER